MIIKIIKELKNTKRILCSTGYKTYSSIDKMQKDQINNEGKTIIKQGNKELLVQGKAKIYTKYIQKNQNNQLVQNEVFYNPVQIFNRDFTILVMQAYINLLKEQSKAFFYIKEKEKFDGASIVDALSASGLRTIRFIKQLQGVKIVYANDLSPASHKLMKDNFQLNQLDPTKYKQTLEDANMMLIHLKKQLQFDIVDLDPYGSVVPFLDASIQSIRDGGMMCVTCTDNKVTAGPDISKCYYYYGTTRAKVHHFNENALRIVLSTISSAASRHCKYIVPMISFQTDFYLRVFFRVYRGKMECSQSGTKIGNIYNCNACGNYQYSSFLQQKKPNQFTPRRSFISSSHCNVCDQPYYLNGPVWLDPINNLEFAQRLLQMMEDKNFKLELKTHKKVYGTLVSIRNFNLVYIELYSLYRLKTAIDFIEHFYSKVPILPFLISIVEQGELSKIPLGFNFDKMCKTIKSTCPSKKVLFSAVQSIKKDFKIAPSYVSPGFYKTNAPIQTIYDLIKSWKKKDLGQDKYILPTIKEEFSVKILKKPIEYVPDFEFQSQNKIKSVPHFIKMGKNMGPKGKPMSRVLNEGEANDHEEK